MEEDDLAEAERLSAEETSLHAIQARNVRLTSALGQMEIYAGMGEMLTHAHAERFRLEQDLLDEQLGRREDVGKMHDEMLKLRKHLEAEMRSGLEGYRDRYQEEAMAASGAEAREAMVKRHEGQARASQEHAGPWQTRYEQKQKNSEKQRLALEEQTERSELQAKKVLALKRRVKSLRAAESRSETLAQALVEQQDENAKLRQQLEECKHDVQIANRQTARALHAEARRRAEAERFPHELRAAQTSDAAPVLQPRSEAILRLASLPSEPGLDYDAEAAAADAQEVARVEPMWRSEPGASPPSSSHLEGSAYASFFSWTTSEAREGDPQPTRTQAAPDHWTRQPHPSHSHHSSPPSAVPAVATAGAGMTADDGPSF